MTYAAIAIVTLVSYLIAGSIKVNKVGGLYHWRIGRLGGSFYWAKAKAKPKTKRVGYIAASREARRLKQVELRKAALAFRRRQFEVCRMFGSAAAVTHVIATLH